jgi:protein-L-isoaspartate O-methyltransferase
MPTQEFVADLKRRPIAEQTGAANEQHYEVPTEFYLLCLGKNLKYSSCLYKDLSPRCGLDAAEAAMLSLYCERAQLVDGQRILELGCGWGSLSLFMASRYPKASITVVSNSRTQKEFIDARAAERGITNLTVVTANMADETFAPPKAGSFDRIVSVEMFEHMKARCLRLCATLRCADRSFGVRRTTARSCAAAPPGWLPAVRCLCTSSCTASGRTISRCVAAAVPACLCALALHHVCALAYSRTYAHTHAGARRG